jgi:D-glycero-D-manno-heptose 1,7-bisphosphate phosphatase
MRLGWVETSTHGLLAFGSDEHRAVHAGAPRPAVFLDRDGVLNELVPDLCSGDPESPLEVSDVRLIAGAAAGARELARAGFALVCVSNQPAAAKEQARIEQLQAVHERVVDLLARERVHLDASRLCLHHPRGLAPVLSCLCDCRKPQPGMLLDATGELGLDLGRSWMIGDTSADVEAGRRAGCGTVLIEYPGSAHKRVRAVRADALAQDLKCAAPMLLGVTVSNGGAL